MHAFVVLAGSDGRDRRRRRRTGAAGRGARRLADPVLGRRRRAGRRGVGPRLDAVRRLPRRSTPTCTASRRCWPRPTRWTTPPTAAGCADQALRSTERVVHGWARERDWRLPEHFTADWTPLPDYNRDHPADPFRPYGVTVGHQFEWARAGPAPALRGRSRPTALTGCSTTPSPCSTPPPPGLGGRRARRLPVHPRLGRPAGRRGPACTGCSARPSPRPRCWPRSPASRATATRRRRWREHGEARFADPATGSWHHELTHRRRRHRHLVRAARRLPPGPDAAARRPARARQHRRRACADQSASAARPPPSAPVAPRRQRQTGVDLRARPLELDLGRAPRPRRPGQQGALGPAGRCTPPARRGQHGAPVLRLPPGPGGRHSCPGSAGTAMIPCCAPSTAAPARTPRSNDRPISTPRSLGEVPRRRRPPYHRRCPRVARRPRSPGRARRGPDPGATVAVQTAPRHDRRDDRPRSGLPSYTPSGRRRPSCQ